MSGAVEIKIRPYIDKSDRNFILNSFMVSWASNMLRSQYKGSLGPVAKIFLRGYNAIMLHLLHVRTVKVACLADEPDIIVGYVVGAQYSAFTLIDFVYVKYAFRHKKIGHALCHEFDIGKDKILVHTLESRVPHKMFRGETAMIAHIPIAATLVWHENIEEEVLDGIKRQSN